MAILVYIYVGIQTFDIPCFALEETHGDLESDLGSTDGVVSREFERCLQHPIASPSSGHILT